MDVGGWPLGWHWTLTAAVPVTGTSQAPACRPSGDTRWPTAVLQCGDRQIMWHFAGTCQEVLCCGHGGQHAGSCGQVWGHHDITMNDLLGHFSTQELALLLDPCISFNVCTDIFKPTWLMDEVLFYLFRILQLIIIFTLLQAWIQSRRRLNV